MVVTEFPEHWWKPWKFETTPHNFWTDILRNIQAGCPVAKSLLINFISDIAYSHGLTTLGPGILQTILPKLLKTERAILNYFGNEIIEQIINGSSIIKNTKLLYYLSQPNQYWKQKDNQVKFLNFIKDQLGGKYEDLYKISFHIIINNGGKILLDYYRRSPSLMIMSIYSSYSWKPWLFSGSPIHAWVIFARQIENNNYNALINLLEYYQILSQKYYKTSTTSLLLIKNNFDEFSKLLLEIKNSCPFHIQKRLNLIKQTNFKLYSLLNQQLNNTNNTNINNNWQTPKEFFDFLLQYQNYTYEDFYNLTIAILHYYSGNYLFLLII